MSEQNAGGSNAAWFPQLKKRRARRRAKRLALAALAALALAVWLSGAYRQGAILARELADSVRIAFTPAAGWPADTGIPQLLSAQPLGGGLALLGKEDVAVFSAGGNKLRTIQHGYARPALSAGNTRFCLYGRSGYELRVESRTETLYRRSFEQPILLAQMSVGGSVAVVTASDRYAAELTVWDNAMEFRYGWDATDAQGVPVRLAFARDNRRLAAACLTARGGDIQTNLFVLDIRSDEIAASASFSGGLPVQLAWLDGERFLVVGQTAAAVFDASSGQQTAAYSYGGRQLAAASVSGQNCALLFAPVVSGSGAALEVLDPQLQLLGQGAVDAPAAGVVCTPTAAYVLRKSSVAAYSLAGEPLWEAPAAGEPLAVVAGDETFVVTAGQADLLAEPRGQA